MDRDDEIQIALRRFSKDYKRTHGYPYMERFADGVHWADKHPLGTWRDPGEGNIPCDVDLIIKLIGVNTKDTVNVLGKYNENLNKFTVRGYHIDFAKEPLAYMIVPSFLKEGGVNG